MAHSELHNAPISSELLRDDPSFADLVEQFVEGLTHRLETMRTALTKQDFEELRRAAHQLKGSGGGYGYPLLTHIAGALEQQASEDSVDGCIAKLKELEEVCSRVHVGPPD